MTGHFYGITSLYEHTSQHTTDTLSNCHLCQRPNCRRNNKALLYKIALLRGFGAHLLCNRALLRCDRAVLTHISEKRAPISTPEQYTALQCNTLQYTTIHCNTLQYTAIHCNTLQYTAIHCNTLQHTSEKRAPISTTSPSKQIIALRKGGGCEPVFIAVHTMITYDDKNTIRSGLRSGLSTFLLFYCRKVEK